MSKKIIVSALLFVSILILAQSCFYSPKYIYRVMVWQDADYDDFEKFDLAKIDKAASYFTFPIAKEAKRLHLRKKIEDNLESKEFEAFLASSRTHAFIIVKNDSIYYENYFLEDNRTSLQTSFSISKSLLSLLVGIAIQEGHITSVDDRITKYIPELIEEDERFQKVTIKSLLTMKSGLEYSNEVNFPFVNADNSKTYYHPDLRRVALKHSKIEGDPGQKFKYNNYNALLIGMVLERSTEMTVSKYFETKVWHRIGAEFDASWSTDKNDFEKMESGFNSTAIDFAKIGLLFLNQGEWGGSSIINRKWIEESTQPRDKSDYQHFGNPKYWSYNYFWWGIPERDQKSDFMAIGNLGQFIYVSPKANIVIVRNGEDVSHMGDYDWIKLFYSISDVLSKSD